MDSHLNTEKTKTFISPKPKQLFTNRFFYWEAMKELNKHMARIVHDRAKARDRAKLRYVSFSPIHSNVFCNSGSIGPFWSRFFLNERSE